ncbi:MAG: hypothetical protein QGH40_10895 [bacterium]|jgi:hypothetical protein|nr:hypothetical protein [bacterium]|tara:strand:- start:394 stop:588 length:195 start_codon:yes stop_codon:yes gene_type:complete
MGIESTAAAFRMSKSLGHYPLMVMMKTLELQKQTAQTAQAMNPVVAQAANAMPGEAGYNFDSYA